MGVLCNRLVGALPYSHYVMRSFPLCGVRVLHSAQYDLTRYNHHGDRKKKTKTKTVPWLSSSRSDWHVLQHRCQPTPTPAYMKYFTASVPTEANHYIYIFSHCYFPASGQAVVTRVVPSSPRFLPSIFIAHRVQQSHWSSIFYRVLLTHALALAASQFVHKKKSRQIYTSMHSAGLELTKLTYTRLEDDLIRHRGD